jgi:hypothetical protein
LLEKGEGWGTTGLWAGHGRDTRLSAEKKMELPDEGNFIPIPYAKHCMFRLHSEAKWFARRISGEAIKLLENDCFRSKVRKSRPVSIEGSMRKELHHLNRGDAFARTKILMVEAL